MAKREVRITRAKRLERLAHYTGWMASSVIPGLYARKMPKPDLLNVKIDAVIDAITDLYREIEQSR